MTTPTLYEALGGDASIDAAVNQFYIKVLADPLLVPFFEGVDREKLKQHQKKFMTMAFGGPNQYSGRSMRAAHADLVKKGLAEVHFNKVATHLNDVLVGLKVPAPLIQQVMTIVASTKSDVLGR